MSTGAKVAIGCGIAFLVVVMGVAVVVVGGAYWVKGKAEEFTGEQKKITDLQQKANANTFVRPDDSVVSEDRLVKFLEIRKRVFVVYTKHEAALEALKPREVVPGQPKPTMGLSDVRETYNAFNDIRLAQAQAQADLGMSDDEYQFMVEQVYRYRAGGATVLVPPANTALFERYDATIKQYAMPGLEWMGT